MTTTTTTRNLKLRVSSDMSVDTKYNLNRLDSVGAAVLIDTSNNTLVRSVNDISLLPESADLGGSGTGGVINLGSANQPLSQLSIFADFVVADSLSFRDRAVGGTQSLLLAYNSSLDGPVDTESSRQLNFDLQGADRNLILGGDITLVGGSLVVTVTGDTSISLPVTGTLASLDGAETLTNKIISPLANTIVGLLDSNIDPAAAIAGSKIVPTFTLPVSTSSLELPRGSFTTSITSSSTGSQNTDVEWELPPADGISGQVISTDGAGKLGWTTLTVTTLSGLTDVDTAGLVTGDLLQFDGTKWVPGGTALAGFGLDFTAGVMDVVVDNTTLEIPGALAPLQVKNLGITNAKIATGIDAIKLADGSVSNIAFQYLAGVTSPVQTQLNSRTRKIAADWVTSDGVSKTITHSLATKDIVVAVYDQIDDSTILVNSVIRPDTNTVTLTASVAPSSSWRVVIIG